MKFIQAYKMAIKSILGNKVRSLLTMLGVIIGVSSVIIATSFAQGSTSKITSSLSSLGTNLVSINITGRNSNRNVTYGELVQFQKENSTEIVSIAPQASSSGVVKVETKSRSTTIVGTTPEFEEIKSTHVENGRFLTQFDIDKSQRVALIGSAVNKDVFKGVNSIGKDIKIQGQVFTVVGILTEKASGQDQSDDDRVIIPISVATKLNKSATIKNFSVQATSAETTTEVVAKLNNFLLKIYKNTNSFRVSNSAEMLSTVSTITSTMMLILGGIAGISLVVGGIGIMNIMLVSVTERTREIGIRKAIGAKKRNILIQFLIEALMITGIGGIIGVVLALAVVKFVIGGLNIVPESYSLPWISASFGISLVIGVVFGMYPATKAANLNPIDALMYE